MEYVWRNVARLHNWKTQHGADSSHETLFEQWVFVQVASVLFEQKAGELLTLSAGQFQLPITRQLDCIRRLATEWCVACHVLQQSDNSSKVILYVPDMVEDRIREVPSEILYDVLMYPRTITPDTFVAEVGRRWREQNVIPHEVGLALGYPVKDVLGYMGLQQLDCTGCCGWRVYGDPTPSLTMSRACQDATRFALHFLHNQSGTVLSDTAAA